MLNTLKYIAFAGIIAASVWLLWPFDSVEQGRVERAEAGQRAYDDGNFAEAARAFEDAARAQPPDGHLYFDLGLTQLRAGKLGEAMGALLTARRLLPRDPDVNAALRHGTDQLKDRLATSLPLGAVDSVLGWLRQFTPRELAFLTTLLAVLTAWGAVSTLLIPKWRGAHRGALAMLVLPALALGATIWRQSQDELWGAVRQVSAKVYGGPTTKQSVLFELREGAPFVVTQAARDGFLAIALSDGKKGWIAGTDVSVYGLD